MNRPMALALLIPFVLCGCPRKDTPTPPEPSTRVEPTALEVAGLHNVYKLTDRLYSGSGPEGEAAFASLAKLGVKTVLSVDGAKPDVVRARQHGMRYVHLPVGYDGIRREQALRIARAVRDLPGPVYLHCHHGKHRGPAAAAVALLCLEDSYAAEQAVTWMQTAGTDPHYKGLFAAPRELRRPTAAELAAVSGDFPEAADPGGLAKRMVEVDHRWDNLKLARKAGWKVPPNHPDIDPPHEARQLAELYHESARLLVESKHDQALRDWFSDAERTVKRLESALRGADAAEAEKAFKQAATDCTRCHTRHRDVPRER